MQHNNTRIINARAKRVYSEPILARSWQAHTLWNYGTRDGLIRVNVAKYTHFEKEISEERFNSLSQQEVPYRPRRGRRRYRSSNRASVIDRNAFSWTSGGYWICWSGYTLNLCEEGERVYKSIQEDLDQLGPVFSLCRERINALNQEQCDLLGVYPLQEGRLKDRVTTKHRNQLYQEPERRWPEREYSYSKSRSNWKEKAWEEVIDWQLGACDGVRGVGRGTRKAYRRGAQPEH